MAQPERRRSLRVPDSRKVEVVCGGTTINGLLTNLSTLGALVVAPAPPGVAAGQTAQLKIPVAAGGKLVAEGKIARVGVPAGSIALSFPRPLNEFPIEAGPAMSLAPETSFDPPKSNPLAAGCVYVAVALAGVLAIGALILAFKG